MSVVASKRTAPLLQTPLARAWRRYHSDTKELRGIPYEEAEPWAWLALQDRLKRIKKVKEGR